MNNKMMNWSIDQKYAVQDVMSMIRSGNVGNEQMLKCLMDAHFTYEEAVYALGYLKDNKNQFIK